MAFHTVKIEGSQERNKFSSYVEFSYSPKLEVNVVISCQEVVDMSQSQSSHCHDVPELFPFRLARVRGNIAERHWSHCTQKTFRQRNQSRRAEFPRLPSVNVQRVAGRMA